MIKIISIITMCLMIAAPALACENDSPRETPDVPAVEAAPFEGGQGQLDANCDTDWEVATFPERCDFRPYRCFVQGEEFNMYLHYTGAQLYPESAFQAYRIVPRGN